MLPARALRCAGAAQIAGSGGGCGNVQGHPARFGVRGTRSGGCGLGGANGPVGSARRGRAAPGGSRPQPAAGSDIWSPPRCEAVGGMNHVIRIRSEEPTSDLIQVMEAAFNPLYGDAWAETQFSALLAR